MYEGGGEPAGSDFIMSAKQSLRRIGIDVSFPSSHGVFMRRSKFIFASAILMPPIFRLAVFVVGHTSTTGLIAHKAG
jgi:hypothetical protein